MDLLIRPMSRDELDLADSLWPSVMANRSPAFRSFAMERSRSSASILCDPHFGVWLRTAHLASRN